MKNFKSYLSILIIAIVLVLFRFASNDLRNEEQIKVTTWDAFGYYMYLPGTFIYNDVTELNWLENIEEEYQVTGGFLYQANQQENGKYAFKYLGGVAVMQTPFFLIGHLIASNSDYKADGFSPPYQYAIAFGAIIYCLLGLMLLRIVLLNYFKDRTVALTLLFLALATNLIQYVAIDGGQSHAYIFPLYALLLLATMRWHDSPSYKWAALIGLSIGLATISRPTEAIMIFIPIFWGTHTKELRKEKWQLVRNHKRMILTTILFGVIGIAPQLIYWKIATGSFVYDVGSKWFFFNPWFRVLFGFTNGWFIYTPITILFVAGFFFLKSFPFRKSVIIFCLLNIWIIIAWSDWQYGAAFSTRAMVQSYPVFALAFAAIIAKIETSKWKYVFYAGAVYLLFVNLFQIGQYNKTVLHYRDMNRNYYGAIYLDADPTPLDMSLLDTDEQLPISSLSMTNDRLIYELEEPVNIVSKHDSIAFLLRKEISIENKQAKWFRVRTKIRSEEGMGSSRINCKIYSSELLKEKSFRLFTPIAKEGKENVYEFDFKVPEHKNSYELSVFIVPSSVFKGEVVEFSVMEFYE
ncbi:MAG: glycosyltransferase family 39 protein [Fluviicola sp.]|nr:glycosyltransferase family 39 protein [Fluviicola sp.]